MPIGLIPLSKTATGNFICDFTENPVNGVRCVGDLAAASGANLNDEVTITIHVFVTADGVAVVGLVVSR